MPKKILIVEDEQPIILALAKALEKNNYNIITAGDGSDGLQKALEEHPDLILLDILLPIMDGIQMLDRLREDEWGKTAPIIILTNLSDEEKAVHAKKYGVIAYVVKADVEINDLANMITGYLS